MCTACMTEVDGSVAVAIEADPLIDPHEPGSMPEWRERVRGMTTAEINAEFKRWNAAQPVPWPVCPVCDSPFDPADNGFFHAEMCTTCDGTWAMAIVSTLVRGGRKDRRAAKGDLRRLRRRLAK